MNLKPPVIIKVFLRLIVLELKLKTAMIAKPRRQYSYQMNNEFSEIAYFSYILLESHQTLEKMDANQ